MHYVSTTRNVPAGSTDQFIQVNCLSAGAGLDVVEGGVSLGDLHENLVDDYPTDGTLSGASGTVAWGAHIQNGDSGDHPATIYAICVSPDRRGHLEPHGRRDGHETSGAPGRAAPSRCIRRR